MMELEPLSPIKKLDLVSLTEFMFADLLKRKRERDGLERRFEVVDDRPVRSLKRKFRDVDWATIDEQLPRTLDPKRWLWQDVSLPPLLPPPDGTPPAWVHEVRWEVVEFEGRQRGYWSHCEQRNFHVRNTRIVFFGGYDNPEIHYYEIDGSKLGYTGCTTFLHHWLPDFEAKREEIAGFCLRKKDQTASNPYRYMKTKEEVMGFWETNRDNGSCRHAAMDDRLQGRRMRPFYQTGHSDVLDGPPPGFYRFLVDYPDLEPYATEFSVFDMTWLICGQFDALFWDKRRQCFILVDWKNCLTFRTSSIEKGTHPLSAHMDNCHLVTYTLQLNTYRMILEKNYGFVVAEMWIVNFPPLKQDTAHYDVYPAKRVDMTPFFNAFPVTEERRQRWAQSGCEPGDVLPAG